ncbi:MAG: hypothetical protein JOZ41_11560, partial [Chloroflexi bacterium]|nr:hypothetical protein [Chloroflexota bacterium]
NYTSKSEGVSQPFGYQGDTVGDGTGLYDTGNGYYNSQAGYSVDGSMWETPNAKRKGVRGGCPRESVWCMKITRKLVAYIRPLEGNHFNLVVRGVGQTEGQGDNFHINATQVTDSGKVVVQGVLVQGKKSIDDLNPYTIDPTDAGNIAIDAADMLSWITGEANLENTDFWYQAAYVGDENFTYMLCELVTSKVSGPDNVNCKQFSNLHESTITFSAEHDNISVLPMS